MPLPTFVFKAPFNKENRKHVPIELWKYLGREEEMRENARTKCESFHAILISSCVSIALLKHQAVFFFLNVQCTIYLCTRNLIL